MFFMLQNLYENIYGLCQICNIEVIILNCVISSLTICHAKFGLLNVTLPFIKNMWLHHNEIPMIKYSDHLFLSEILYWLQDLILNIDPTFSSSLYTYILYIVMSCSLKYLLWDVDGKSALVEVKAWCHLTPSHYLNQYWQISNTILHHCGKKS